MATITLKRDRLGLSPKEGAAILDVMRAMLSSAHFAKSKRYPALLEYCVQNTLEGDLFALKERVIGSELFGRPANYDASEDPVVRIAAGEVRKRIALYFDENRDSPVRIDLPLGSYACTFHFKNKAPASLSLVMAENDSTPHVDAGLSAVQLPLSDSSKVQSRFLSIATRPKVILACAAIVCAAGALGVWQHQRAKRESDFWWPVFHKNVPALIVVGHMKDGPQNTATMNALTATVATEGQSPRNQLQMANAVASAEICGVLQKFNRTCDIVPARTATFEELRHKSIVLVGGFDNPWTERLLAPLRFNLNREVTADYPTGKVLSIVDREQKSDVSPWRVDRAIPLSQLKSDYLIIARFRNEATDGDVLVAAGIWTRGTQSAGEFVTSPEKMAQIISLAPAGWKGFNFEAVLQTDVIEGGSGNVKILATEFW